jgi:putative NADH-flavin reductase
MRHPRGAVVKIFLLGATGNAGERILREVLARSHEVTAMVRDEVKLPSSPNLRVIRGSVDKSPDLARPMVGHDVVINAAGNVAEAPHFTKLVETVIDATTASLGEGGRLWVFGGAALLTVPGTRLMAVDLPGVPRVYEANRTNLAALQRSRLDWSMLCPGPMIASENGKPTSNLRLTADEWPMARPTYTYILPIRLALAIAFKQKVPELNYYLRGYGRGDPRQSLQKRALLPSASRSRASSWAAHCHANNQGDSARWRSGPTIQPAPD